MKHTTTLKHLNTSVYSPFGETLLDQLSVCIRMSAHYRKVYTCKSVVDTSSPTSYRLRHKAANNNNALVNALVYDIHNPPSTYRSCYSRSDNRPHKYTTSHTSQRCKQIADVPCRAAEARKLKRSSEPIRNTLTKNLDCWQLEEDKVRSHSAQSNAKASSCDSAYSGGLSSASEHIHNRKDEIRYSRFIQEITEDVLKRGVFTNKGLQLLFQRHIKNNESVLDKERMEQHVYKLSQDLGLSADDTSKPGEDNPSTR